MIVTAGFKERLRIHYNADRAAKEMASYHALKRLIAWRSLVFVSIIAVVLSLRAPLLGLNLECGGLLGIANLFISTRANERLLDGLSSKARRASQNLQRIIILAAVPVIATLWSPAWAMTVTFSGIFLPLVLYALELQRRYRNSGEQTQLVAQEQGSVSADPNRDANTGAAVISGGAQFRTGDM